MQHRWPIWPRMWPSGSHRMLDRTVRNRMVRAEIQDAVKGVYQGEIIDMAFFDKAWSI